MPEEIPDLTPPLRIDYQSPFVILRRQGAFLKKKTGGILDAMVDTTEAEGKAQMTFDVLAPVLNHRERIMVVTYQSASLPYPAVVQSVLGSGTQLVANEETFMKALQQFFSSPEIITLFQSLIAKTNENRTPVPPEPPTVPPSRFPHP